MIREIASPAFNLDALAGANHAELVILAVRRRRPPHRAEAANETDELIVGSSVASVGHIRDLPAKEMVLDLQTFEPTYQRTERGAQVVSRLKTLVSRADQVLLATDPDREGEAISWQLLRVLCPRSYPL